MDGTRPVAAGLLEDAVGQAAGYLRDAWVSVEQGGRVVAILERFAQFCSRAYGVDRLAEVTPEVASAFLWAPTTGGAAPSLTAVHYRRSAIRLLYRSARLAGVDVGDPTLDLVLPRRGARTARPLTDDEVVLCRGSSIWSLTDTRHAAAWALAEATCRTGELPYIERQDVDLDLGRVWLHDGRRTAPRWGQLSEWGIGQIERRLASIDDKPEARLIYSGSNNREGGRVATSLAVLDVLRRAGLADDPEIRPSSIAAWAGRQILSETGQIEVVAHRLGLNSLDRTARFISWDWTEDPE